MTQQHSQPADHFANTRWSLVMRQTEASPDAQIALTELVQRYGYPVYAYIRRCGHSPDVALEMTQTFLQHVIGEFQRQANPRATAHYREYLLERLHDFLGGDWREAVETDSVATPALPDMEPRYQRDHTPAGSPDRAFQRAFALEVLHRAMRRLREEVLQTGRMDMFAALEPFLARDPDAGVYEQMAATLRTRPLVLAMALKRLRQRLRELTTEELADTVDSPDNLLSEQDILLNVLREHG
jgi:RNA polymerase sigma-70 factor (ECF subfamily)